MATAEPEMLPIRPLEITATLAGPPRYLPNSAEEKSIKNAPPPKASSMQPNIMKSGIKVADAASGELQIPSVPI